MEIACYPQAVNGVLPGSERSDRRQIGEFTIIPRYIHSGTPQSPQEFHSLIHNLL
jgi:hypothetical protein